MNRLKPRRLRPYSRKVFVEEFDRKGELTYAAERMRELDELKGDDDPLAAALDILEERMAHVGGINAADKALSWANRLIDGAGVRGVEDPKTGLVEEMEINTGDPYSTTLLYDARKSKFYITTFGDWLELRECQHGRRWSERLRTF